MRLNKSKSLLHSLLWWLLGSRRISKPFWLNHHPGSWVIHYCLPSRGRWTSMSRRCDLQRLQFELICLSSICSLRSAQINLSRKWGNVLYAQTLHMFEQPLYLSFSGQLPCLQDILMAQSVQTPSPPQVQTRAHIHMGPCS